MKVCKEDKFTIHLFYYSYISVARLRQGKFIYIAHFIHNGNSKCLT